MALFFALIVVGLVAMTVVPFLLRSPMLPELISLHGGAIDNSIFNTLYITGAIFVVAQLGLAWLVFKNGGKEKKAIYLHGNNKLEYIWTSATAVLFLGLNITGQSVWVDMHLKAKPTGNDVVHVEVTAQQFDWNFRYPGPDGKFGKTDVSFVNNAQNPLGLDPKDKAGKDDVITRTMAIPVDTSVVIHLKSKDVIHAFFVRQLRVKQDAVPGLEIQVPFQATKVGEYDLMCAELCGLGHYKMKSMLKVLSKPDYQKWLDDNAP